MKSFLQCLPPEFLQRMEGWKEFDFEAFCQSYEKPPYRGIRLNRLKCTAQVEEKLMSSFDGRLRRAPFSEDSYYLPDGFEGIGKIPLHHGGAFYVQEPSAASAVTVLAPQPGDRVLDLCAAPGGKSTQIASLLQGKGLVWSNEIVKNRAQILLSNMERMGVRNAVISSCHPERLCAGLAGFFDKVLVDAPCSGEGMFSRDPQAIGEWSQSHVEACAQRQLAILKSASQGVKEGGILVYSTCTFSPEENEGVIAQFLDEFPGFRLMECGVSFGRPGRPEFGGGKEEMSLTRRIFPMDGGAGHFVAKFLRLEENFNFPPLYFPGKEEVEEKELRACLGECFSTALKGKVEKFGGFLYEIPEGLPFLQGLGVLRAGVCVGEIKKGRIEPAHGIFAAASPGELARKICLEGTSWEAVAFLHGEEIPCKERGYTGVVVDGVTVGFGKASNGMLKNRYPKGLRNL